MAATIPTLPSVVTPGDLADDYWAFIDHLKAQNVSGNTVYAYAGAVASLAQFLVDNNLPTDTKAIERRHTERWQIALSEKGYKSTTVHLRYRRCQRFFAWFENVMDDVRGQIWRAGEQAGRSCGVAGSALELASHVGQAPLREPPSS